MIKDLEKQLALKRGTGFDFQRATRVPEDSGKPVDLLTGPRGEPATRRPAKQTGIIARIDGNPCLFRGSTGVRQELSHGLTVMSIKIVNGRDIGSNGTLRTSRILKLTKGAAP